MFSPSHRRPRHILLGSVATLLAFSSAASAVENLWIGTTSNDWNTPTNWSLGRVPSNANGQTTGDTFDDAVVNTATNFPVITTTLIATPRDIVLGSGAGTTGRVDHRAGTAATGGGNWMWVGREGGFGIYNLANTAGSGGALTEFGLGSGSLNIGGRLYVGGANGTTPGSTGSFNMNTSGNLTVGNDLTVGSAGGTGVMSVDAGTITTGGWNFIGKNEGIGGGNGTLRMSGGTFTNNGTRTYVGLGDSTGSFQMSGGTYNNIAGGNDTFFAVGVNNLSNATTPTLNMTGGTINSAHVFSIGGVERFNGNGDINFVGAGKGAATVNGAGALINSLGEFWVGQGGGSTGELTLSAGTIAVSNWIDVGRQGATGKVTVTGGSLTQSSTGNFIVGDNPGGNGTLTQSGGTIAVNTGELWVGQDFATGQIDISGGTMTANNWVAIGRFGGTGTMNLSGGTFNKTGNNVFIIADPLAGTNRPTTGVLNQSGNSNLNTNEIWVGQGSGGNGTYNLSAGTLTSTGWIAVGRETGTGVVNISGTGAIVKAGNAGSNIIVGSLGGNGTINQTGGSVTVNPNAGSIFMGEGTSHALWDLSGGTVSADSFVVGWKGANNELRVRGTGTLSTINFSQGGTPNQPSGGAGVTNQTGGRVNVSGSLIVQDTQGTGSYNLSGGTLSVDGSIEGTLGTFTFTGGVITRSNAGVITYNGNLTTGAPAATLSLGANKTFQINGAFDNTAGITLELTGLGIPDQPARLNAPITGSFALGAISTVPAAGAFNLGLTIDVGFDATFNVGGQGSFTATRINEDAPFNASTQSVYWLDEDAGVVTLQYSVIPEPSTAAMATLAGFLMLGGTRRRRT